MDVKCMYRFSTNNLFNGIFTVIGVLTGMFRSATRKYQVPMKILVISFLVSGIVFVIAGGMPVTKADDWSNVTAAIQGAVGIMPSIGDLIGAVLPVILKLAIYSFIIGLFGALLVAIKEAMSWGR